MLVAEDVIYCESVAGITLEHVNCKRKHDMDVRHFHDEYEIFYMVGGARLFFFQNRSFWAKAGDLILIESDMIHMTSAPPEGDPGYERYIFYVSSQRMKELDEKFPGLNLVRYLHEHTGVYHLSQEMRNRFMALCGLFQRELRCMEFGYPYIIEMGLASNLVQLVRDLPSKESIQPLNPDNAKYKRVYEIADYVSKNCTSITSLDDLAVQFFISKYYMCRIFKEITGCTVIEYLTIHKLQEARKYLERSDLSISQVAEQVGYNSLTHFEKEFKRYMLVSPNQYRKGKTVVTYFDVKASFPPSRETGIPQGLPL